MSRRRSIADRLIDAGNSRKISASLRAPLTDSSGHAPPVEIGLDGTTWPSDVTIARRGAGFAVIYPAGTRRGYQFAAAVFIKAYLYWLAACSPEVAAMTVTVSDGDAPSRARFSPSSPTGGPVPIPDAHFFKRQGFAIEREAARSAPAWRERSDILTWRGAANGFGRTSFGPDAAADLTVLPRIRLVRLLETAARSDVGLTPFEGGWQSVAAEAGLTGSPVPKRNG